MSKGRHYPAPAEARFNLFVQGGALHIERNDADGKYAVDDAEECGKKALAVSKKEGLKLSRSFWLPDGGTTWRFSIQFGQPRLCRLSPQAAKPAEGEKRYL